MPDEGLNWSPWARNLSLNSLRNRIILIDRPAQLSLVDLYDAD